MMNCPWCGERIIIPQLDYNLYSENINKLQSQIDKAIKMLEEAQEGLEEWHFDGYDPELKEIIKILKGEGNE